jgi:hypothetical protein
MGGGGLGIGKNMVKLVGAAVDVATVDGEGVVGPPALDVHQVKQARTIGVLVEHADGKEVGLVGGACHGAP